MFGEALLNDGVTFVLYEGVKELAFVEDQNIENISVAVLLFIFNIINQHGNFLSRLSPMSMFSFPSSPPHWEDSLSATWQA